MLGYFIMAILLLLFSLSAFLHLMHALVKEYGNQWHLVVFVQKNSVCVHGGHVHPYRLGGVSLWRGKALSVAGGAFSLCWKGSRGGVV